MQELRNSRLIVIERTVQAYPFAILFYNLSAAVIVESSTYKFGNGEKKAIVAAPAAAMNDFLS